MAAISYFDYGGSYQTSLGVLRLVGGSDTPRTTQRNRFAGVNGTVAIDHGKAGRALVFAGLVYDGTKTNIPTLITAVVDLVGEQVATIRHYTDGSNYTDYTYCRITNVTPQGAIGFSGSTYCRRYQLVAEQLIW